MKCEDCGVETSVATYSPDATGLMCWFCTDCAAKTAIARSPPRCSRCLGTNCSATVCVTALKAALVEACDMAEAGEYRTTRIAELRQLAEEIPKS